MNLFPKKKRSKVCATHNMIEHFYSDRDLSFENTPLQNLKNILSDADATMQLKAIGTPKKDAFGQSTLFEKKGVSKSALQEAMNDLFLTQGQYISSAVVGQIVCKLCSEGNYKNKRLIEEFTNNTNINKLEYLVKSK